MKTRNLSIQPVTNLEESRFSLGVFNVNTHIQEKTYVYVCFDGKSVAGVVTNKNTAVRWSNKSDTHSFKRYELNHLPKILNWEA